MVSKQLEHSSRLEVDQALKKLQAFYNQGEAHLKLARPYGAPGTRSEKESLAKAKAFANPISGYTRAEFNQLIVACRKQRFAVNKAHIIRLVSVQKGPLRQQLQNNMLAQRWSTVQLNLEIRKQFGNRRPRAGRVRAIQDWADAQSLLIKFAEQWQRMLVAIESKAEKHNGSSSSPSVSAHLSPAVKRRLQAVDRTLLELKQMLEQQNEELHKHQKHS